MRPICRLLGAFIVLFGISCSESSSLSESDYAVYRAVLQDLVNSRSAGRLVIRRVAKVDHYRDMVYAEEDSQYFEEFFPTMNPELVERGRARISEEPVLRGLDGEYDLLDGAVFSQLASVPFLEAAALSDSILGPETIVVCLTSPARLGDQAIVFVAFDCWERNALVGEHYLLRLEKGAWRVVGTTTFTVN